MLLLTHVLFSQKVKVRFSLNKMAFVSISSVSRFSQRLQLTPACFWNKYQGCRRPLSPLHSIRRPLSAVSYCEQSRLSNLHPRLPYTALLLSRHMNTEATTTTSSTTASTTSTELTGEFQLVYTGALKGAVRALKVFSLTTAVLASFGGPVLVWLGKESVPVSARIALSSIVLLVSLSTTGILHWLLKGYITHLYYQPHTERVAALTLSFLARRARSEFPVDEMRPPSGLAGFSTFQAHGKGFFMHAETFPDKHLLSVLLDSQTKTGEGKKD